MGEERVTFSELVRQVRRQRGITQSELARELGCTQAAISMFEGGRADALSKEKQDKIVELLGIDRALLTSQEAVSWKRVAVTLKFCPVDECPSNIPYVVGGRVCFRPSRQEGPKGVREWCPSCGEILEETCPNDKCHADICEGAFCRKCGTPYVEATHVPTQNIVQWADEQRSRIRELRDLSATERLVGRQEVGGVSRFTQR